MNNTSEARKIKLAQALFELDSDSFLTLLEELFQQYSEEEKGSRWIPTEEEIEGIKEALKEVEEGKFVSLEEAKERHKKWLK